MEENRGWRAVSPPQLRGWGEIHGSPGEKVFELNEGELRLALIIILVVAALAAAIIFLSSPEIFPGLLDNLPYPECIPGKADALQPPLGCVRP